MWVRYVTRPGTRSVAPARVDSYEGLPGSFAREVRASGIRATCAAPILVDGNLWGAFEAGSNTDRSAPTRRRASVRLPSWSRRRSPAGGSSATSTTAPSGVLSTLALSLQFVARSAEPATASALKGCIEDLHTALAELRELARGLHPAVLTKRGVPAALQALAARSPVPVVLDAALDRRLPRPHEAALYFVAAEALTNAAKYAKASAVEVTLHGDDRRAEIANADDGVGGARAEDGSGLRGLGDRVEALGGRLTVASTRGHGTTVRARVPIAATNAAVFSALE